jgi:L-threonylcarbamoyladenylate synthase
VLATLESRIPLILDAGPTPGGLESTVLDLTVDPPTLLRPGLVTPAQIEELIRPILRQPKADQLAKSPGMLARHYAPRTPLVCVPGNGWREVRELVKDGFRVGWLPMSEGENLGQSERMVKLVMPSEAPAYATALYAALHTLDVSGLDRIVVQEPPMREEWLAVHDRLRRASTRENS